MKNIALSVRDRLQKISRETQVDFQLLLIRFFQERMLYRLSRSNFKENFCLKGGALLYALEQDRSRPTLDLDLLGMHITNDQAGMQMAFNQLCYIPYEADGVVFHADSISTTTITNEGKYPGVRLKVLAQLGNIKQNLQIDIGFGDVVTPKPVWMAYPVLLDLEAPEIQAYSVETVIAEKFEAMIDLGELNSRMKDFYDLYRLLQPGKYDRTILLAAIKATFKNRQTPYIGNHSLFKDKFASDENRLKQWSAFLRKSRLEVVEFSEVHEIIREVLEGIYGEIRGH
ncbi:MAG: nucleotidyl transferase AbiEii/AbiGii toxin family protein [Bacteroidales bacterium]|nr:nucleotidyl transferase AbiEii/AbiGii toxin family protein [Bacteroidales bacterium]